MRASCCLAIAAFNLGCVFAQEPAKPAERREPPPRIELEYVSSDIYRTGSAVLKVWRGLHLEGDYYGDPEFDVGVSLVSWMFEWKALRLSPGLGIGYGSSVEKAATASLRWNFETRRWFSQGLYTKGLGDNVFKEENGEEVPVSASILDNNHFSIKLGRFEAGPMWEQIKYRRENAWKGGFRGAIRWKKFKGIVQMVGPDFEVRGGVAFEY